MRGHRTGQGHITVRLRIQSRGKNQCLAGHHLGLALGLPVTRRRGGHRNASGGDLVQQIASIRAGNHRHATGQSNGCPGQRCATAAVGNLPAYQPGGHRLAGVRVGGTHIQPDLAKVTLVTGLQHGVKNQRAIAGTGYFYAVMAALKIGKTKGARLVAARVDVLWTLQGDQRIGQGLAAVRVDNRAVQRREIGRRLCRQGQRPKRQSRDVGVTLKVAGGVLPARQFRHPVIVRGPVHRFVQ